MNAELSTQTQYGNARPSVMQLVRQISRYQKWIRCPKCIGGNMYREINGEYTCLQCGCSCHPATVTETPKASEDCISKVEKLPDEFHIVISD
jgi:uncharacterized protein (DUF983 family)